MRPLTLLWSALALAMCATAFAQTTHFVGGGGAFQAIRDAVQAASPGDTIVVRPGNYGPLWINKELTVLGDPGAVLAAPLSTAIEVYDLPAGSRVAIHGFEIAANSFGTRPIWLHDNQGHVHLEQLLSPFKILAERCTQISLRNVDVIGGPAALHAIDSHVVITRSQFLGLPGIAIRNSGLRAEASRIVAVDCQFQGSEDQFAIVGGGVGLWLVGSELTLTGNTQVLGGASPNGPPSNALHIGPGSRATLAPSVQLLPTNGGAPTGGSGTLVTQPTPSLDGGANSSRLSLRVNGTAGGAAALYIGERRSPFIPTPFGDIWVGTIDAVRIEPIASGGSAIVTFPLPQLPLGTFVTAQAGILAGSSIQITQPLVLRLDS